jgi:glycosyltransferase involved in cell wall biosynthesis
MKITSFFYADPDLYPPVINVAHILHQQGIEYGIVSRLYAEPVLPVYRGLYPVNTVIMRIHLPNTNSLFQYLQFMLTLFRNRPRHTDVIIGYDMHGLVPARLVSWLINTPLVYHSHDYVEDGAAQSFGGQIIKLMERYLARTADVVIVPDRERADVMVEQLKLKRAPLIVANAPLVEPPPSTALQEALANHGRSFSRIVFRQGRIGPNHALELTLRSMPMWVDGSWGFVIMGPAEPSYRDHLIELAASLGVPDRFVILPAVPYPQVGQYTVGADLGHGLYEPNHVNNRYITMASNKIMEYIAAGLPVLLSESSGSHSLLEKYRVGVTADVTSPELIADAVNSILSNPQLIIQMRAESKRAFHEEFNYAHQYAPVIERFKQLVSENNRGKVSPGQD